jgi:hypothetical protein
MRMRTAKDNPTTLLPQSDISASSKPINYSRVNPIGLILSIWRRGSGRARVTQTHTMTSLAPTLSSHLLSAFLFWWYGAILGLKTNENELKTESIQRN